MAHHRIRLFGWWNFVNGIIYKHQRLCQYLFGYSMVLWQSTKWKSTVHWYLQQALVLLLFYFLNLFRGLSTLNARKNSMRVFKGSLNIGYGAIWTLLVKVIIVWTWHFIIGLIVKEAVWDCNNIVSNCLQFPGLNEAMITREITQLMPIYPTHKKFWIGPARMELMLYHPEVLQELLRGSG